MCRRARPRRTSSRAYKKLAKQHHPDANPGNAAAEERFKEISAAYDVLGDDDKRKEYDEVRQMVASGVGPDGAGGFGPGGFGGGGAGGGRTFRFDTDGGGGLGDIFGNLFGGGGGGRRRGARRPGRSAAATSRPSCTCSSTTRSAASRRRCGSAPTRRARRVPVRARRPGTMPETCPECRGAGTIADDQGPFSFSQVCPTCGGRGQVIPDSVPARATAAASRCAPAR